MFARGPRTSFFQKCSEMVLELLSPALFFFVIRGGEKSTRKENFEHLV